MSDRTVPRPRLLDLFCGAGGCTAGYQRAGFYVVGVDLAAQPNYCGDEFHRADAMTFPLDGFDAIHASPPCQHYAPVTRWRGSAGDHPDLLPAIRDRLARSGKPWVIENVPYAPLTPDFVLCGTQFGLPLRRHRWFATNWGLLDWQLRPPCHHRVTDHSFDHGSKQPESIYRDALGVPWMTVKESREAIPPAYTEWIGAQLLDALGVAA